jgi:hypothetical protein
VILGVILGDMIVEMGAGGEHLSAIFAGPGERAREVNVLYVLAHVDPLAAGLATEDAAVEAASIIALFNVGVQIFNAI